MAFAREHLTIADNLDFAAIVRPGDRIVCGQAAAEPLALTQRLMAQAVHLPRCELFIGPVYSRTFDGSAGNVAFASYGAMGRAVNLASAGRLRVEDVPYGAFCAGYDSGERGADIVLVQLSSRLPDRGLNLSLSHDYVVSAAKRARVVIAEINPLAPWVHGGEWPDDFPLHVAVAGTGPPVQIASVPPDAVARQIAGHAVSLVPDGAVLQFGVGKIPEAIVAALRDHRRLGIHSGLVNDVTVDLIEAGAVDNSRKAIDPGVTITNQLIGTQRLYEHAHDNTALALRPAAYTHGLGVIARLKNFVAINSAIEVGLDGAVNAQRASGRVVGGIGGQLDVVRGANASEGGRAIIALPAASSSGVSRIVPMAEAVTTPAHEVDAIVTEFGAAELRGCDPAERARRLIAIAAPEYREALTRAAFDQARDRAK